MLEELRATVIARCRQAGYPEFAWWIPLFMDGCAVVGSVVAVGQRAPGDMLPTAGLMLVAIVPWLGTILWTSLHWLLYTAPAAAAIATAAALYPVDYDFAMFVLVMLAGHLGATVRPLPGLAAVHGLAVLVVVLAALGPLTGSAFWLAALVVGWDVGFVMQYQQRRMDHEHRQQEALRDQAVLAERHRIAREVHDVIAHSLSVTMLHLTAARRALDEDRAEGVDEASEALRDAERQGRAAMTDIRRTVGLLGHGAAGAAPAPDVHALPELVDGFRSAGLDVTLEVHGDPRTVPPQAGLGLYRIMQESLANVAKHEPDAAVAARLECADDGSRLRVENTLRVVRPQQPGGSGLRGMRERAELLGGTFEAGVRDGAWVLEVAIPSGTAPDEPVTTEVTAGPG